MHGVSLAASVGAALALVATRVDGGRRRPTQKNAKATSLSRENGP